MYAYTTYPVLHASIPSRKTHDRVRYKYAYVGRQRLFCVTIPPRKSQPMYLLFKTFYLITLQTTPALPSLAPAFLFFSFSFFLPFPPWFLSNATLPATPPPPKKNFAGGGGGIYVLHYKSIYIYFITKGRERVVIDCQNLCPPFSHFFSPL